MKRARPEDVVAFLGPSLSAAEARRVAPCRVLPPARAGDVLAVLPERPLAIALVDGLFDTTPSVWHHELVLALDAGVAVFGASSMGALRAAELGGYGVVGVGRIFGWYRDGRIDDDGEVALLHGDAAHGFRPLTVPLVNVRAAADAARAERLVAAGEARAVVAAAAAIPYAERTWPRVLSAARLGEAEIQIRELLQMGPGSVLKLDRQTGEPVDLYMRGTRFATGYLVVVGEQLGVRVKEILAPQGGAKE